MNINLHIIKDELKDLNVIYTNSYENITLNLSAAQLLKDWASYEENIVYVCTADALQFVKNIPQDMWIIILNNDCYSGIAQTENILMINNAIDLDYLLNRLSLIFQKYANWELSLLNAIIDKTDIQTFFDRAITVFPNPLYILDSSNILVLYAGIPPENCEGTIWQYFFRQGYYSFDNPLKDKEPKSHEKYYRMHKAYWLHNGEAEFPMISANIFEEDVYWGNITMSDVYAPLSLGQLSLFEYLRRLFQKYLKYNEDYGISTDKSFVPKQLIGNDTPSNEIIQHFLQNKKWKPSDNYYMIVWDPANKSSIPKSTDALAGFSYVTQYFSKSISFIYDGKTVTVIRDSDYAYRSQDMESMIRFIIKNISSRQGVSMPFYNFADLKIAYNQCIAAIKYADGEKDDKDYYLYKDYYFMHLTDTHDESCAAETFCDQRILKLKRYDEKKGTNMVETLLHYLKYSQNAVKAAEKMYLHRNTLNYRLNIIKDITGIDFNKQYSIDHLLISCMLLSKNKPAKGN